MQLYKEELKHALKVETTEQRENHAMIVMAEERLIHEKGFLQPLKSAQRAELEDELLQLRELQYLARYGDYMKIVSTRLRLHASKHKSKNWPSISGNKYWSRIAVTLGTEEEARKEAVCVGAKVKLPTTDAGLILEYPRNSPYGPCRSMLRATVKFTATSMTRKEKENFHCSP